MSSRRDQPAATATFPLRSAVMSAAACRGLARVQRASARMGEIYHMSGAMRLARNISFRAAGWHLLSRNDWLYGYWADVDEGG